MKNKKESFHASSLFVNNTNTKLRIKGNTVQDGVYYITSDRNDDNKLQIGCGNHPGENIALTISCDGVTYGALEGTFNGFSDVNNIPGSQGPGGGPGPEGPDGPTGLPGIIGLEGTTGATGATGVSIVGATGLPGGDVIGDPGVQGPTDIVGATGLPGTPIIGPIGPDGPTPSVAIGPTGPDGPAVPGPTGATGTLIGTMPDFDPAFIWYYWGATSGMRGEDSKVGPVFPSLSTALTQGLLGYLEALSDWASGAGGGGSPGGDPNFPVVPSDRNVKENIVEIKGSTKYAHLQLKEYKWTWNALATKLYGLKGASQGVMADEVKKVLPQAVLIDKHGYQHIIYAYLDPEYSWPLPWSEEKKKKKWQKIVELRKDLTEGFNERMRKAYG